MSGYTSTARLSSIAKRQIAARSALIHIVLSYAGDRTTSEVSRHLKMSRRSIEGRLSRGFDRYGVRSRLALFVVLVQYGHITPEMIKNVEFAPPRTS